MPSLDRSRIRPLVALRAIRELLRNPDDTSQVFHIVEALKGGHEIRTLERMRATATGREILENERELLDCLANREALRRLPEGSLGHQYASFMDREQISAEGLVNASGRRFERTQTGDPAGGRLRRRMRDSHDLWHVVTGYDRDLIGEAALLAFTYAQTRNRGVGLIVAIAWLRSPGAARRVIREAFLRGRRAGWLPAVPWEALLPLPLAQVRAELGLELDPPSYDPLRSAGAPALA